MKMMINVRWIIDLLSSPIVEWNNQNKPAGGLQLCSQFPQRLDREWHVFQCMVRYHHIRNRIGNFGNYWVNLDAVVHCHLTSCGIDFYTYPPAAFKVFKGISGGAAKIEDTVPGVYVTLEL
jgi:hypothetical protein